MPAMDALQQGDGKLPGGVEVEADYYRRFEDLYPVPGRPDATQQVAVIVTTPEMWASRPESSDPAWRLKRDAMPLVVATRLDPT
jgi:hypothetical protein